AGIGSVGGAGGTADTAAPVGGGSWSSVSGDAGAYSGVAPGGSYRHVRWTLVTSGRHVAHGRNSVYPQPIVSFRKNCRSVTGSMCHTSTGFSAGPCVSSNSSTNTAPSPTCGKSMVGPNKYTRPSSPGVGTPSWTTSGAYCTLFTQVVTTWHGWPTAGGPSLLAQY